MFAVAKSFEILATTSELNRNPVYISTNRLEIDHLVVVMEFSTRVLLDFNDTTKPVRNASIFLHLLT